MFEALNATAAKDEYDDKMKRWLKWNPFSFLYCEPCEDNFDAEKKNVEVENSTSYRNQLLGTAESSICST